MKKETKKVTEQNVARHEERRNNVGRKRGGGAAGFGGDPPDKDGCAQAACAALLQHPGSALNLATGTNSLDGWATYVTAGELSRASGKHLSGVKPLLNEDHGVARNLVYNDASPGRGKRNKFSSEELVPETERYGIELTEDFFARVMSRPPPIAGGRECGGWGGHRVAEERFVTLIRLSLEICKFLNLWLDPVCPQIQVL